MYTEHFTQIYDLTHEICFHGLFTLYISVLFNVCSKTRLILVLLPTAWAAIYNALVLGLLVVLQGLLVLKSLSALVALVHCPTVLCSHVNLQIFIVHVKCRTLTASILLHLKWWYTDAETVFTEIYFVEIMQSLGTIWTIWTSVPYYECCMTCFIY